MEPDMSDTMQARAAKTARAAATGENVAGETLRTEIPSSVTDAFDKGIARAKDAHEKIASILVSSTEALEEAFSSANRGSAEYRAKLAEIVRSNTDVAFATAREALDVKSLPELFELAVTHQRKLIDHAAVQVKELSALTQKVVAETTEPIRTGMTEPFKMAS
jgi:hypothetical protein